MAKPKIYLAGPMAGLSIKEAKQWRIALTSYSDLFELLSPCRDHEDIEGVIEGHGGGEAFMCKPKEIYSRDTHDIFRSDAILVNFTNAEKISIGTVFELGYASGLGKPIVTVGLKEGIHDHVFTQECGIVHAESLAEGMIALKSMFNR